MQQKMLHKLLNYVRDIDTTEYSAIAYERKEKLEKYQTLASEGCSQEIILSVLEISRASYYRWKSNYKKFGLAGLEDESRRPNNCRDRTWSSQIEQRIYHLRKEFYLWGKAKLAVEYKRKYNASISKSMIGRILRKLIDRGKIQPVRFFYGKKDTRRRVFNGHAQRWKQGMKSTKPGELIQVDHMSVHVPGFGELKHFNAVCPFTKYAAYQVYTEANSKNAADFLAHMKRQFPFEVSSIQVDGGPEFMADFEKACSLASVPLWVLPPRSPELNANVERGNGTVKYEFYYQYDRHPSLYMIQKNLQKFAYFYNSRRPHQGIGHLTPIQYFESIKERPQSHMS